MTDLQTTQTIAAPAPEPFLKRTATLLTVITASLGILTMLGGWVWRQTSENDRHEYRIQEVEKKVERLDEVRERVGRIEENVSWIRRALEGKR